MIRILATTLIVSVALIVALTFLANGMKRQTLFFPAKYPEGQWDRSLFVTVPRELTIPSSGLSVHAWLFESKSPASPLLIWHHGNGGNLTHRAEPAAELARLGISVLVFDYRGYGKSQGRPSEKGLYLDALAVYDYVVSERLGTPERIFAYGESLGGPYAAYLASKRSVRGVILENSFHSAGDVASRVYRVPIGLLLGNSLATADHLMKAKVPVLVMHGRNDRVIPLASALRLYEETGEPKELWISETADHSELSLEKEYFRRVTGFVRRALVR